MKIFVVGMPQSGRTTVAKAICQEVQYQYIDATDWAKSAFRPQRDGEHPQQYHDDLHHWYLSRLAHNPNLIINEVNNLIESYDNSSFNYVIDGISSPRDLTSLFDYNKDIIVFLNRTNNDADAKDYENIGVSVMRDYCFWLASAELLSKDRWFEYNFSIPGEDSDWSKALGHKNSVLLVKSINKAISHFKEMLFKQ